MSGSAISLPYFSYAHRHCATETPVPFHQHGGCEMLLIVRGRCRVESSLGTLEGRPGILIIIPPGLRHNQLIEPGERNLFCVFQASPELFPQTWRSMDVSGLGWVRRTFLELKRMTDRELFAWAHEVCQRGAGELLFTSMDHDGTRDGYPCETFARLAELPIPIIASGGAGSVRHIADVLTLGRADAALAASIFHYNEIPIPVLKRELSRLNINVRQ